MYALIFSVILIPSGFSTTAVENGLTYAQCESILDQVTNEAADAAEIAGVEIAIQGECRAMV